VTALQRRETEVLPAVARERTQQQHRRKRRDQPDQQTQLLRPLIDDPRLHRGGNPADRPHHAREDRQIPDRAAAIHDRRAPLHTRFNTPDPSRSWLTQDFRKRGSTACATS
jgi:hypothetical protein